MPYHWVKLVHLASVGFSLGFFALRLGWALRRPDMVRRPWARYPAQVNDTLLLAAGIALAVMSGQYPFAAPWLTAKLAALPVYILLGLAALRFARTAAARLLFGTLALATAGYMVAVALCRTPAPWACAAG